MNKVGYYTTRNLVRYIFMIIFSNWRNFTDDYDTPCYQNVISPLTISFLRIANWVSSVVIFLWAGKVCFLGSLGGGGGGVDGVLKWCVAMILGESFCTGVGVDTLTLSKRLIPLKLFGNGGRPCSEDILTALSLWVTGLQEEEEPSRVIWQLEYFTGLPLSSSTWYQFECLILGGYSLGTEEGLTWNCTLESFLWNSSCTRVLPFVISSTVGRLWPFCRTTGSLSWTCCPKSALARWPFFREPLRLGLNWGPPFFVTEITPSGVTTVVFPLDFAIASSSTCLFGRGGTGGLGLLPLMWTSRDINIVTV